MYWCAHWCEETCTPCSDLPKEPITTVMFLHWWMTVSQPTRETIDFACAVCVHSANDRAWHSNVRRDQLALQGTGRSKSTTRILGDEHCGTRCKGNAEGQRVHEPYTSYIICGVLTSELAGLHLYLVVVFVSVAECTRTATAFGRYSTQDSRHFPHI